jgi:bifunctional non-homologous end joining protein LigD
MAGLDEYRKKRDFGKTAEPAGRVAQSAAASTLRFVVQKHAASHLHYDLRLEMDGVMRSWAVPKGPSTDPAVRRLAMEVEDHPVEYNDFEGTIPEGEYGGGTVMLWDRGTYAPEARRGESHLAAARRGYEKGRLSFRFEGERLKGSYTLVRTEAVQGGARSRWLLLKQNDDEAVQGLELTDEVATSVTTGRTMEEIAAGAGGSRVWHSNRGGAPGGLAPRAEAAEPLPTTSLSPMLATSTGSVPSGGEWVFEPKYDGIRVLAFASPAGVSLVTRNGHDKSLQFPEIVEALRSLVRERESPLVLDGEIVALEGGRIARFERLQSRMHVKDHRRVSRLAVSIPAALVAFDLLLDGEAVLLDQPWRRRRAALEAALTKDEPGTLMLSETSTDYPDLRERGQREGWEGVMAKRADAPYRPSKRSADWLKLKLENQQELVIGGWTEPRNSREHLGAILLGYFDADGKLVYAGHTGTGFDRRSLEQVYRKLKRLERKTSPFTERPRTNAKAHWVTPRVVAEIRFNEWTREGKLRQPVFLGLREDKDPRSVVREVGAEKNSADAADSGRKPAPRTGAPATAVQERTAKSGGSAGTKPDTVVERIRALRSNRGEGTLSLGRGGSIPVTSLGKVFFPRTKHTKGDLFEYYAAMSAHILPAMRDRPLVLKRFPNGVEGEAFYQQAAPEQAPRGVRVETLTMDGTDQLRLVGGNLATLLYTVQLGAISYDPWHSRVGRLDTPDFTIIDLDPGPGATFRRVVRVAGWVKEELEEMGLQGALKTSGSEGLHIYLPLTAGTPLEAATLVAQIIATRVAQKHPKEATVERMTKNRPHGTVYVDYLQNILGKTVAGVYAVRARPLPTVSTPLAWDELTPQLDLREFTIETVPARVEEVGDLWAAAMRKKNSPTALLRSLESEGE